MTTHREGDQERPSAESVVRRHDAAAVQAVEAAARMRGWPPLWMLRYRRRQAEIILGRIGVELRGRIMLEIGGGVSGHGALFADMGATVVSSDLLTPTAVHGGSLIEFGQLHSDGQSFVCARAEALPLVAGHFDIVFSSYVLEHVAERDLAVAEMWRVLRDGGVAVNLVPNVPQGVLGLVYRVGIYSPRQALKWLLLRTGLDLRLFGRRAKPDLAILPHGAYRSVGEELRRSTVAHWDKIFADAGFRVIHRSGISHESYLGLPSFWLTSWLQNGLLPVLHRIGRSRVGLLLAPGYVLVAQKETSDPR